jgi:hypothetical protein
MCNRKTNKSGGTARQVEGWCGKRREDAENKELVGNSNESRRMEETSEEGHDSLLVVAPMMMMMMID